MKRAFVLIKSLCYTLAFFAFLYILISCNNAEKKVTDTFNSSIKETSIDYRFTDNIAKPAYPELKEDLSNVSNIAEEDQKSIELLNKHGFYTTPSSYKEFYELYNSHDDYPTFISTDVMLHTYHSIFDYYLKEIEETKLLPMCQKLCAEMVIQSLKIYNEANEPRVKTAAMKNAAYFAVAEKLAGVEKNVTLPLKVKKLADAEMKLIEKGQGIENSVIFPYRIDYSQFKPRGHYTKSKDMSNYFKAMMWFGNIALPFEMLNHDGTVKRLDEQIVQSILMGQTLTIGKTMSYWDNIYKVTAFFVGSSDDITPNEINSVVKKVYGEDIDINRLWNDEKLANTLKIIKETKKPLIGATMNGSIGSLEKVDGRDTLVAYQFRFMGQRYILDSEVFYRLTSVLGNEAYRPYPKGLDFPAALGSSKAYDILTKEYKEQDKWSGYLKSMDNMRNKIDKLDDGIWTKSNLYNGWIWALRSIIDEDKDYYPETLSTGNWQEKSLNTFLGSWAELRHDTILYSKQSEPQCGSAPPPKALAYVEPNVELYERFDYLTQWMKKFISENKLVQPEKLKALDSFNQEIKYLLMLSKKELKGKKLTEQEYTTLKNYGYVLENIYIELAGGDIKEFNELKNEGMAVIADTHNYGNSCVEVGVGYPDEIYVVVPIEESWYVARGGVFSYYEFIQPINKRLTDKEWKKLIEESKAPEREKWIIKYNKK